MEKKHSVYCYGGKLHLKNPTWNKYNKTYIWASFTKTATTHLLYLALEGNTGFLFLRKAEFSEVTTEEEEGKKKKDNSN